MSKSEKRQRQYSMAGSFLSLIGLVAAFTALFGHLSPWWAVVAYSLAYMTKAEAYWIAALWASRPQ